MSDIDIRVQGSAGRITLNRPKALNALTYDMIRAITAALAAWRDDAGVKLVIFDAAGDKAFCAGGDIADLYAGGKAGDYGFGKQFWRDEYRMNAQIAEFPKPVLSFMQGFTMGGGVGVGCHAGWRVVGETSQIAMPECSIGLVPDVGGSLILAQAPGRLGVYLGLTGARMSAGDAILAGFADHFIPQDKWASVIAGLTETGTPEIVDNAATEPPESQLGDHLGAIDTLFRGSTLQDIIQSLKTSESDFARQSLKHLARNSPLSMACALEILTRVRATPTIRDALTQEYRFTARACEHGDFIEGIRAAIIDKDRAPNWKHQASGVTPAEVAAMMAPHNTGDLTWKDME